MPEVAWGLLPSISVSWLCALTNSTWPLGHLGSMLNRFICRNQEIQVSKAGHDPMERLHPLPRESPPLCLPAMATASVRRWCRGSGGARWHNPINKYIWAGSTASKLLENKGASEHVLTKKGEGNGQEPVLGPGGSGAGQNQGRSSSGDIWPSPSWAGFWAWEEQGRSPAPGWGQSWNPF